MKITTMTRAGFSSSTMAALIAAGGLLLGACGGDTDGGSGGSGAAAGTGGTGNAGSGGAAGNGGAGGGTLPEPENHRPTATMCDDERPSSPVTGGPGAGCQSDADCTAGRNGRCTQGRITECTYDQCLSDSDCGDDQLCACEGASFSDANVCLSGNCRVDSDCGGGGFCSPTFGDCGNYSGVIGYYCRTAEDECLDDSDCVDQGPGYCAYTPQMSRWACGYGQCAG